MYKRTSGEGIIRMSDGAGIPPDINNSDWVEFLRWKSFGNDPLQMDIHVPTQEETDVAAAKNYSKLNALKAMTPAQVVAWVDANINTLADAKDALKTLAVAANILARRI